MKKKDLMLALEQYDDNALVFVSLGMGTVNRIEKCVIKSCGNYDDLFEVKNAKKDENTASLILFIE